MIKKILLTVGTIILGLNFGIIAGFSPIILFITMVLFPEDALNEKIMIVTSLISAVISGVGAYVYGYLKKREHEMPNSYGMALAISFAIGAVLTAVLLFIYIGDPNNGMPNRLI